MRIHRNLTQSEIDDLLCKIESGEISKLKEINQVFKKLHEVYFENEWTWVWDKIQSFYGIRTDEITTLKHIEDKKALGNELIDRIKEIQ